MAVALGGATLVFALALGGAGRDVPRRTLLEAALSYERTFWAGVGLLAMTGVGNLATFGAGLAPPESAWGATFLVKLSGVIAVAALSVPRTLAVAQLVAREIPLDRSRLRTTLRVLYGTTAGALAGILALAVWLAHR
ncbi:MAG: hypothetical protein AUH85_17780 [Chloroflexi bacterium 13_1_40CM_4_68_4]|nr:MAG: hypothetical protein AUH85_17780 [Chloroflexi bacterium 13_1_40CM_4_68_4]